MPNSSATPILEYDYIYMKRETDEFCNANIKLFVAEEFLTLIVETDCFPDIMEINEILNAVKQNNLQKLKIDIQNDLKIIIKADGDNSRLVSFDQKTGEFAWII